ncbi:MAG: hypothetical protein MUC72_03105 [Acidobacteria bacterium]|nr:hypothetical protein [Acidobacteriota bacterium]
MKRFLLWGSAALALFVLVFLGLNLFDSRLPPGVPAADGLAVNMEPGNGFFLIWGFAEAPGTDPLAESFRHEVSQLFAARPRGAPYRSPYGRWLARLNAGVARHWQGMNLYFPLSPGEDSGVYFAARRSQVAQWQERFAPLLQRYRQVLQSGTLEDFTPLNWECPARSVTLATQAAKLFAAAQVLAAMDGRWPEAGDGLLAALAAGLRLVDSGRTVRVNALGRTMVELSLRALSALLNFPDCPPGFARRMRENLAQAGSGRFGTGAVRAFHWLSFRAAIRRVKEEKVVDPFLLKDYFREPAAFYAMERLVAISGARVFTVVHALAAFFIKENETVAMLRAAWERIGQLEETPPWSWEREAGPSRRRIPAVVGEAPFWWLRNPLGKMMVRSTMPYTWPILRHYVYRSHELKTRYDLVRLLARARLAAGPGGVLGESALRQLLAEADERDPFSGAPYRFGRERQAIYGIGSDRNDDRGREEAVLWRDSDIAVPVKFVIRDS